MQAKAVAGETSPDGAAVEAALPAIRAGGAPLPAATRAFFEPRFGHDFSRVRVHTDARASESARSVRALAYTVGQDIVFREQQYAPATAVGKQLLAHELAHVVQQTPGLRRAAIPGAAAVELASGPRLQRQDDDARATAAPTCPIQTTGTVSRVSWGETSGIYPTANTTNPTGIYNPANWDPAKICLLLRARAAVHAVGARGERVHRDSPGTSAIDRALKPYHFTENFPAVDGEIANDAGVRWFYLGTTATTMHTGIRNPVLVKSYGPFFNGGGGDVPRGPVYINFFKTTT